MSKDSHQRKKLSWRLSWLVPVCIAPVIALILTPPDLVTFIIVTIIDFAICLVVFQLLRLLRLHPAVFVGIAVVVSFLISKWQYQIMKAAQPQQVQLESGKEHRFDLSVDDRSALIERSKSIPITIEDLGDTIYGERINPIVETQENDETFFSYMPPDGYGITTKREEHPFIIDDLAYYRFGDIKSSYRGYWTKNEWVRDYDHPNLAHPTSAGKRIVIGGSGHEVFHLRALRPNSPEGRQIGIDRLKASAATLVKQSPPHVKTLEIYLYLDLYEAVPWKLKKWEGDWGVYNPTTAIKNGYQYEERMIE